jgi:hypothetical protein
MPCKEYGFIENNGSVPKSKIQVIFYKKHSSGFMVSTQMLIDLRDSTKNPYFLANVCQESYDSNQSEPQFLFHLTLWKVLESHANLYSNLPQKLLRAVFLFA